VKIRGGTVRRDYFPGKLVCEGTLLGFLACNLASSALPIIDICNLETKHLIFRVQELTLIIMCGGDFNHIEVQSLFPPASAYKTFEESFPTSLVLGKFSM
jgi:hypothetical protein